MLVKKSMVSDKTASPWTATDFLAGSPYGLSSRFARSTRKDELVNAMPFRPNRLERAGDQLQNLKNL
jgi:hypothetical protein